jgi:hypothetical protein
MWRLQWIFLILFWPRGKRWTDMDISDTFLFSRQEGARSLRREVRSKNEDRQQWVEETRGSAIAFEFKWSGFRPNQNSPPTFSVSHP